MTRILPGASPLTQPYWDAAREGRLIARSCLGCGRLQHPPMPRCLHCHGAEFEWVELSGRGVVYAFTVVQHPTHFAFADRVPYAAGVVELEEGVRIVTDFPVDDPFSIRIGMPVVVTFDRVSEEVVLPRFVPAA